MRRARSILLAPFAVVLFACGGETPPAQSPSGASGGGGSGGAGSSSSSASSSSTDTGEFKDREQPGEHDAIKMCGQHEKVHTHDLHSEATTEAFVPCARAGGSNDYAGLIKVETIPEGVHIVIHATDDQVKLGMLGADAKTRDAVIVYPRGKGSQAVEVPLLKTSNGYTGDKVVLWDDLGKLTDEGTKIEIAVFDHDGKTGETSEELHVAVAVSTGKSCEKAQDENPQTIDMGKKAGHDLSTTELGAPMKDSSWFSDCGLADSADADICVAVKNGKPLGVSVNVTPLNNKVAACIDRRARKLHFPASEKLDVVHQKF